jgi:ribosome-binding factor A
MSRKRWMKSPRRRGSGFPADESFNPRAASPGNGLHRVDRKLLQLCQQVADTLAQVLGGECDDEMLRSLQVVSVTPAPDSSQLLVIVAPLLPGETLDPTMVLARLAAVAGRLRTEVAASITRRRAPRLMFQFAARAPAGNDESPGAN